MAIPLGMLPPKLLDEWKKQKDVKESGRQSSELSGGGDKQHADDFVKDGAGYMPCFYLFEPTEEEAARIKVLINTLTLDIEYDKDNVFFPCPLDRGLKGDVKEDLAYCEEIARSCMRDDGPFKSGVSVFIDRRTLRDESVLLIEVSPNDEAGIDVVARVRVSAVQASDVGRCVHNSSMYLQQYVSWWPDLQDDVTLVESDSESLQEEDGMELREHEHERGGTLSQEGSASSAFQKEAASMQGPDGTPTPKQVDVEMVDEVVSRATEQAEEQAHHCEPSVSTRYHNDESVHESEQSKSAPLVRKDGHDMATDQQKSDKVVPGDESDVPTAEEQVAQTRHDGVPRPRCPIL